MSNQQDTFDRLKYPGSHTWRDRATIRDGYWPDGTITRISDPEFQPDLDRMNRDPVLISKALKIIEKYNESK